MNTLNLAQVQVNTFSQALEQMDILTRPDRLLDSLTSMPLLVASVIFVIGVLCVLNGYRWHKWVVVAMAAIDHRTFDLLLNQEPV